MFDLHFMLKTVSTVLWSGTAINACKGGVYCQLSDQECRACYSDRAFFVPVESHGDHKIDTNLG